MKKVVVLILMLTMLFVGAPGVMAAAGDPATESNGAAAAATGASAAALTGLSTPALIGLGAVAVIATGAVIAAATDDNNDDGHTGHLGAEGLDQPQ